jgi:hypothetical protein
MQKKKQVEPFKPLTEEEERKAWTNDKESKEIADKALREFGPGTTITPKSGKAAHRGVIQSSASPAELKKTLKKTGLSLSKQQQEIVRGKANRAPVRERMAATGLKRSTLYHKAAKLTAEVAAIRTKPLPPTPSKKHRPPKPSAKRDYKNLPEAYKKSLTTRAFPPGPVFLCDVSNGEDLRKLDEEAALFVRSERNYYPGLKLQLDQHWPGTPARKSICLIRWCPRALLDKYDGPELVASLVNLLEDAKYGDKDVRAAAWKDLAELTKPGRGNPREFDTFTLGRIAEGYHCRVAYFQRKWKATESKPGYTKAAALEEIKNAHREELARFKDYNPLEAFLERDPLEAACDLAATATAIDAKTFKRAFAAWRREQERIYEYEIHKREILNSLYAPSTPPKT